MLGALMGIFLIPQLSGVACAQEEDDDAGPARTIKAGVSKSLYLPEEMYGYWSVTGTLLESNSPTSFNRIMHNIWVLEQVGDSVVITNPISGASASVNVEKVEGQTATFHHTVMLKSGRVFFEMPTVTVNGDQMFGVIVNEFRYLKNGKVSQSYYAKYRLEARRIGGEKIRFQQQQTPLDLEIDERSLPQPR